MRFAPVSGSAYSSPTIDINISGVGHAIANLKTLEFAARRRVVSAAVRAANAVVVRTAKAYAPRRTGTLASSIRGSLKLNRATGAMVGTIQFKSTKAQKKKGRDAYYAHMVIGGTKAHQIPKRYQAGRTRKEKYGGGADMRYAANRGASKRKYAVFGGRVFSRVQHPGIKPNPFMERAAEASFSPAVAAFEQRFSAGMQEEINKLKVL